MTARRKRFRSLSSQLSLFVVGLVLWVAVMLVGYPVLRGYPVPPEVLPTAVIVLAVAVLITLITSRLLVEPLAALQRAIQGVCQGKLDRIHVPGPFLETQTLGDSFNHMVDALEDSRREVAEYQNSLEKRIRQRTAALERALHRALAGSRAKSEFLANMSHEVRTPLNGVLGMLQILEDSPLTDEQHEQVRIAQSCGHTLLALLNDILDLSKIEAERMTLESEPLDLVDLIQNCAASVRPAADAKGVAVLVVVPPDFPNRVTGDALRVRQILLNLLSNAVKFTEKGYVRLTAGYRRVSSDIIEVQFEVADTGIGIPQDKLASIFDKFTQADGSVSRRYGGTGLGLTITRRLVELHGGRVWVASEPGVGSRFHVTLLMRSVGAATPSPAVPLAVVPRPPAVSQLPVLLAEDNEVNQKVIRAILSRRGYRVEVAANGMEALEMLARERFGLVLMDVQMPLLDGLETTRRIRLNSELQSLPVVALTAHAMEGDRERCLEAGMNDYLAKPVHALELLDKVAKYMESVPGPGECDTHPAAPPIDTQSAGQAMGHDPELMRELVELFLHLAPDRMGEMRAALAEGDTNRLCREASRLSTAATSIAARRIAATAEAIESQLKGGQMEGVEEHLRQLEAECMALEKFISGPPLS